MQSRCCSPEGRCSFASSSSSDAFIRVCLADRQIDDISLMNIRKVKRKKPTKHPEDKETLATDKLFEISWLCEENQKDQSNVLEDHAIGSDDKMRIIRDTIKISCKKRSIRNNKPKSNSLDEALGISQHEDDEKKQFQMPIKPAYCIFNTLPSRHVFVGCTEPISSGRSRHKSHEYREAYSPKKGTLKMPIITPRQQSQGNHVMSSQLRNAATFRRKQIAVITRDRYFSLPIKKTISPQQLKIKKQKKILLS